VTPRLKAVAIDHLGPSTPPLQTPVAETATGDHMASLAFFGLLLPGQSSLTLMLALPTQKSPGTTNYGWACGRGDDLGFTARSLVASSSAGRAHLRC